MKRLHSFQSTVYVFFALILSVSVGFLFPAAGPYFAPIGDMFINILLLTSIPLVFVSVFNAIVNIGDRSFLNRLGFFTIAYFVLTNILVILLGLGVSFFLFKDDIGSILNISQLNLSLSHPDLLNVVINLVPDNVVQSLLSGNSIIVCLISVIFGISLLSLKQSNMAIINLFQNIEAIFMKIIDWILFIFPLGVFSLVVNMVSKVDENSLILLKFVFVVLIGYLFLLLFFCWIIYMFSSFTKKEIVLLVLPVLGVAFSTSSSLATLPVTLESIKKLTPSSKVSTLVVSLGAMINMNGTSFFQSVATIFMAAFFKVEISSLGLLVLILTILFTSFSTAGIPSSGIVTLVVSFHLLGIPVEGVALLFAVDRILDMGRTVINVLGDISGATILTKQLSHFKNSTY